MTSLIVLSGTGSLTIASVVYVWRIVASVITQSALFPYVDNVAEYRHNANDNNDSSNNSSANRQSFLYVRMYVSTQHDRDTGILPWPITVKWNITIIIL